MSVTASKMSPTDEALRQQEEVGLPHTDDVTSEDKDFHFADCLPDDTPEETYRKDDSLTNRKKKGLSASERNWMLFEGRKSWTLGVLHLFCAGVSIVFGIIPLVTESYRGIYSDVNVTVSGYGIWCALFVSGSLYTGLESVTFQYICMVIYQMPQNRVGYS